MKAKIKFTSVVFLTFWLALFALDLRAQATSEVSDPLADYYKTEMAIDGTNNLHIFKGTFTPGTRQSIFITDDLSIEQRGVYSWTVYYPSTEPQKYLKISNEMDLRISGPDYIGYVAEVKSFGLLFVGKGVISVQYLQDGHLVRKFLTKSGHAVEDSAEDVYKEDFPKYFATPAKVQVVSYSLQQLAQMYP